MIAEAIKVGDVVRLKSGGPRMTVSKIEALTPYTEEMIATCIWFDEDKPTKYDGVFPSETLNKLSPTDQD